MGKIIEFGSFATGLCLPWSDIDLVLDLKSDNEDPREILGAIQIALKKRDDIFGDI